MFNEEDDRPWRKYCEQCYKQRHRYKKTKFTTVEKSVLYCIKGQPCNTNMLMAYCGTAYRSAISKAISELRKKHIILTVRSEKDGFYYYGGSK
jgi:hypothetical protein